MFHEINGKFMQFKRYFLEVIIIHFMIDIIILDNNFIYLSSEIFEMYLQLINLNFSF
jgi:hypothetical protein